ncbi:hypothetical protein BHM03_00017360 [Ensete ventricosum]|nr:hypothetical protein BHM03_00017360 [Ensete ventricosum]
MTRLPAVAGGDPGANFTRCNESVVMSSSPEELTETISPSPSRNCFEKVPHICKTCGIWKKGTIKNDSDQCVRISRFPSHEGAIHPPTFPILTQATIVFVVSLLCCAGAVALGDPHLIPPSLFHSSVRPTIVSLPSTSPAHGSVVAASATVGVDFYTALSLLPSPPSSSASIFQPPAQPLTASRCCTLPAVVATSSTKSSPASPQLAAKPSCCS